MDLLGRGYLVFAGVRREEDADALGAAAGAARERLRTVRLDVTSPIDIDGLSSVLREQLPGGALYALVNNAGIGVGGPLEFARLDDLRRQFEVNVFGAVAVTQAALPFLRAGAAASAGRGARIVNMSSISGRLALPFFGPYAASKHALEALSDALRVELLPARIHVTLIEPGSIDTPIWTKAARAMDHLWESMPGEARRVYGVAAANMQDRVRLAAAGAIDASRVARAVARALESRRPPIRRLVGRDAVVAALAARLVPTRLRDRLIARALNRPRR
jgi:NAD(P)-dependent dehydrogenase (short-subunit alcohol dehydrogenase family)